MKPFSNGTEYQFWRAQNCDRCKKNVEYDAEKDEYIDHCDIEEALSLGLLLGDVPDDIIKRMGNPMDFSCPEFEESEEK